MKFHADGPDIPDRLLWERDEGNVVFICGAGVSRAKAKMPDFPTLALQVLDELLVQKDNKARKVLELAQRPENEGLVPIDKVFGELERAYSVLEIEAAVSMVLSPPENANTACHEIILDLATTPRGAIRLVTTNLDDLFSRVTDQPEWVCPDLPDFERNSAFSGLAYLHGKCSSIANSHSGNFVLSTRSFGRAYMAEGWANSFLKNVLKHHTVVFVGYSADDPPMQYLLEALAHSDSSNQKVFAFQQGEQVVADEKWIHRGVTPIAFGEYDALWETLGLWRDRALNLKDWIEATLKMADVGPFALADWQRSQVAHLASHLVGAKAIAERELPIPSQWLYCFDSTFRFATPRKHYFSEVEVDHPDPFEALGLIEDPTPKPVSPDDPYTDRPTPEKAWDAFRISKTDLHETNEIRSFASLRGPSAVNQPELPQRLEKLAVWIGKVANNLTTVRWAVHQTGLHPTQKRLIHWGLEVDKEAVVPFVEEAWETLFEAWEDHRDRHQIDQYQLKSRIDHSGWSHTRMRQYLRATAPRIEIQNLNRCDAIFSTVENPAKLNDLVECNLETPEDRVKIDVPDDWLNEVLRADRHNLDQAIEFKKQISLYDFIGLPPILQSADPDISGYGRTHGVNALAFTYLARFRKQMKLDRDKAMLELQTWPADDLNIFGRFRIWSAGEDNLLSNQEAGEVFANLPQRVFWGSRHQRDLLNSLKNRWKSLPLTATRKIEKRILRGDDPWFDEEKAKHTERKAWQSANVLKWLKDNGCTLNLNFDDEIEKLKKSSPSWTPEHSSKADESHESRGGWVRTNTDYTVLSNVSVNDIIDVASKNMKRDIGVLEEADPFSGLCNDHPAKALASLRRKAMLGTYPEWAWSRWLRREGENAWSQRPLLLTSILLCQATDKQLVDARYSVFRWFEKNSGQYSACNLSVRDRLFDRLLTVLSNNPEANASALVRRVNDDIEWMDETINSPAGELAESLFKFSEIKKLPEGSALPNSWLKAAEGLLALGGDNSRFAMVCFMQRLRWFHYWAREWTKENILSAASSSEPLTMDAYWAGLAAGTTTIPSFRLFQKIKVDLLTKFSAPLPMERSRYRTLSSLILAGWLNRENEKRWISDSEFTLVLEAGSDELRVKILWQLWKWSSENAEDPPFDWGIELEHFFKSVWPRTQAAKSGNASERMLEIACANVDRLPRLAPVILPRLGKLERNSFMLGDLRKENSEVVGQHPEIVLELLYASLPNDSNDWPWEINKTLDAIEENQPSLADDMRLAELKRRWAAR